MPKRIMSLLALLFSLALVAAACGSDDDSESGEASDTTEAAATEEDAATDDEAATDEAMSEEDAATDEEAATEEGGTVVDVAVASGEFPTLVAALQASGLDETLAGEGPYTVLAPSEQAFAEALDALGLTAEELLADESLTGILTYHVLPTEAPAATVLTLDGQEVATVNGATVLVAVDGGTVLVNEATVTQTDIEASNGVIHVIDTVLLPPAG